MASAALFNTLDVTRRLKGAGCTEQQAEGIADTLAKDSLKELVTKIDLQATKQDPERTIAKLENTLTIRMAAMLAAALAASHYWK